MNINHIIDPNSMRRIWIAISLIAVWTPSAVRAQEKVHVFFDTPCKCENNHGEDRWKAKTNVAAIPTNPTAFKSLKPSDMYKWSPLSGVDEHSDRKKPDEEQWCK